MRKWTWSVLVTAVLWRGTTLGAYIRYKQTVTESMNELKNEDII